jgi:hypothetical protein
MSDNKKKPSGALGLVGTGGLGIAATYMIDTVATGLMGIPFTYSTGLYILGGAFVFAGLFWPGDGKIERYFDNAGMNMGQDNVRVIKKTSKPYGFDLKLSIPRGRSLRDFMDRKEALENYLDAEIHMRYIDKAVEAVCMTAPLPNATNCKFPKPPFSEFAGLKYWQVPIGYSRMGLETLDFREHTHILIAGQTGSGKSVTLKVICTYLCACGRRSDMVLHLADFKNGVELGIFKNSRMVETYCKTPVELTRLLDRMAAESAARYELFEQAGVSDVWEFNQKFPQRKLTVHIVIIDEFAFLQDVPNVHELLSLRCAQDRGAGQFYILSTQRPSVDVVPGILKANVPTRLGLKTSSRKNSEIIVDETGLETLPGKGAAILKHDIPRRLQVMFIDNDTAREYIKHTITKKPKTQNNDTEGVIPI